MHHSRLCAVLIDCRTPDVDAAARFWGEALGRPVDLKHPASRGNYRMLETPPDEPIVEIPAGDPIGVASPTGTGSIALRSMAGRIEGSWRVPQAGRRPVGSKEARACSVTPNMLESGSAARRRHTKAAGVVEVGLRLR